METSIRKSFTKESQVRDFLKNLTKWNSLEMSNQVCLENVCHDMENSNQIRSENICHDVKISNQVCSENVCHDMYIAMIRTLSV